MSVFFHLRLGGNFSSETRTAAIMRLSAGDSTKLNLLCLTDSHDWKWF